MPLDSANKRTIIFVRKKVKYMPFHEESYTVLCKGVVPDASGLHVVEPPLLKIGSKALIIYSYIYNL